MLKFSKPLLVLTSLSLQIERRKCCGKPSSTILISIWNFIKTFNGGANFCVHIMVCPKVRYGFVIKAVKQCFSSVFENHISDNNLMINFSHKFNLKILN